MYIIHTHHFHFGYYNNCWFPMYPFLSIDPLHKSRPPTREWLSLPCICVYYKWIVLSMVSVQPPTPVTVEPVLNCTEKKMKLPLVNITTVDWRTLKTFFIHFSICSFHKEIFKALYRSSWSYRSFSFWSRASRILLMIIIFWVTKPVGWAVTVNGALLILRYLRSTYSDLF